MIQVLRDVGLAESSKTPEPPPILIVAD